MKALIAVVALASPFMAEAGQPLADNNPKNPIPETCFSDQEFQLDLHAAYVSSEGRRRHGDGWGGGLALNYFFHRYFGTSVDATVIDGGDDALWQFSGHFIFRYPFELGTTCLSPYVKIGGGYQTNGNDDTFFALGGGLEMRMNPRWGIFAEGTHNWCEGGDSFCQARAGLRWVF